LAITRADELGISKINEKTLEPPITILRMEEDDQDDEDLSIPSSPEIESTDSRDIVHVDVVHPAAQIAL
jgi:hypothetical protein